MSEKQSEPPKKPSMLNQIISGLAVFLFCGGGLLVYTFYERGVEKGIFFLISAAVAVGLAFLSVGNRKK